MHSGVLKIAYITFNLPLNSLLDNTFRRVARVRIIVFCLSHWTKRRLENVIPNFWFSNITFNQETQILLGAIIFHFVQFNFACYTKKNILPRFRKACYTLYPSTSRPLSSVFSSPLALAAQSMSALACITVSGTFYSSPPTFYSSPPTSFCVWDRRICNCFDSLKMNW